jgi:hypothetical protein
MARGLRPEHRHAIFTVTKKISLACWLQYAASRTDHLMTASLQHHVRRAGACYQQGQQRCAAMRRAVISVWNKTTGAGNQN